MLLISPASYKFRSGGVWVLVGLVGERRRWEATEAHVKSDDIVVDCPSLDDPPHLYK